MDFTLWLFDFDWISIIFSQIILYLFAKFVHISFFFPCSSFSLPAAAIHIRLSTRQQWFSARNATTQFLWARKSHLKTISWCGLLVKRIWKYMNAVELNVKFCMNQMINSMAPNVWFHCEHTDRWRRMVRVAVCVCMEATVFSLLLVLEPKLSRTALMIR